MWKSIALGALSCLLLCAQVRQQGQKSPQSQKKETHPAPVEPRKTAANPPVRSLSFDPAMLDRSVDPCVDFYQYSCGTWMKNNPIPRDQSRWGRFDELQERNREILREILEQYSANDPKRSPIEQKIGDYYAACMSEGEIERKGIVPLAPELKLIAAIRDKAGIAEAIARLHLIGVEALFSFGSGQDAKNSDQVIAQADQGGLGLPDRDYYLKTDPKSVELRNAYQQHVQRMFALLGERAPAAKAKTVMAVETALAKGSLDLVSRRDPEKTYHKLPLKDLESLSSSFAWPKYLQGLQAPRFQALNIAVPDFFQAMDAVIRQTSLEDLKTYLTWHVVHGAAPLLPAKFVNENFAFYGKTLTGAQELRPRWKRCVDYVDNELGEALGQKYVERTFGAEGKQRTLKMVRDIEAAMGQDIQKLDWMSPKTKQEALTKLHAITNKIGYPDKWRDYSTLRIVRGDALGNSARADEFEMRRQLNKIDKPVDRGEWLMSPPTVNAYYDPQMNNINFPAGILQPPFYDNKLDDPINYGAIGAVIGHELTHGFDDEGRQFDPKGNLRDWWTAQDAKEFEKRAQCIVDEYSQFTVAGDVHINGKLTLGENTADNGGVRLAHMALMNILANRTAARKDGFTPEQRLFLGYGQIWCQNVTEEEQRMLANINPHAPARYRVNGVLNNMPEFRKAFGCAAGQPMVSRQACRVW